LEFLNSLIFLYHEFIEFVVYLQADAVSLLFEELIDDVHKIRGGDALAVLFG
jgi:hypothetical protein